MSKLLQAQGLGKRFGGLQALSDVSFDIEQGEIYGLIGPNGAGKTTLFNVLTGLYIPEDGSCTFNGQSMSGKKPHEVAYAGLARTFQNIRLFANLSAIERDDRPPHAYPRRRARRRAAHSRRARRRGRHRGARPGTAGIRGHRPSRQRRGAFAAGDQRRLEIARALATEPKLLALDEPAAGMNASERWCCAS